MSRNKSLVIVLVAAIAVAIGTISLFSFRDASSAASIGVVVPLTGPMGYLGTGERVGMAAALEDIGATDPAVKLVFEDSQGKPEVALSAVRKLLDLQRVRLVVASTSPSVLAILPAIRDSKADALFVAQCLVPNVTVGYPFAFRIYTPSDQEVNLLSGYASDMGYKRIACLYIRNSFGEQGATLFARKVKELGSEIVASESIDFQEKDFRTLLAKVKGAAPDALFVYCYATNYPSLLKQIEESGLRQPILGSVNLALDGMETKVPPEILGRAVFPAPRYYYNQSSPRIQAFNKRIRAAGAEPTSDVAYFYDTAQILVKAIQKARSAEPQAVSRATVEMMPYEGVVGTIRLDADRDAHADIKLVRWRDKAITLQAPEQGSKHE